MDATAGYEASVPAFARVTLATDGGGASQLAAATGGARTGYGMSLVVRIDTATAPVGG